MKHVTIISTSLNEDSKSQLLARQFAEKLLEASVSVKLMDLREFALPFSGTREGWESSQAQHLKAEVERSSHIVFAVPIYCYDVNSAAKNVIELIGRAFTKKVISFICSAGGSGSYMSIMGFANHLMLDFRSVIVPRFLYVSQDDWKEEGEIKPEIDERMSKLLDDMREIQVISTSS
ncbi:MAG: NAD(P)H-dependent oxidoreductase [Verrucomicrobiota bacterium]